ncbi:ABC transporter substrate-binding protein [Anaerobacillus alkalidiazotrophicus]|uniref:ABC transporter substrate-binding protein n=1 Tax=Anaerobacillus alkalidiazotrophicus TaxID=472963 RepID=A0A1S2M9Z6_9BACI|nr:sugar ABC transporter substrate-binding protein [Anaerobacillus alkalidiazotrophicus]OIJ21568.1 ABC transporter substrate-binding protein [Anaerobacillus alkalidiazotrophicus]
MKKKIAFIIISMIPIILVGYTLSVFEPFYNKKDHVEGRSNGVDKIQLTFWRSYGTLSENNAYKELISAFELAHPTIEVNMVFIPYGDYEMRLRTAIAVGNPPDILSIDTPNLALYANSGSLLSIDEYMKKEGAIEDIPDTTLRGLIYKGEIYLAPIIESGLALFYNMHLFEEAGIPYPSEDPTKPMTWDGVLEIAKKVYNPEKGVYGIDPAQGFADGESAAYFKMPLLWQFGAEVLSPDASTADGYLNSKEALEALQFYQDLYHKYRVAAVELPTNPFQSGNLAMTILGSWHLTELKSLSDFVLGEDFGIAPLPKGKNQIVPNGGWALGISSKSQYPDEAWEFIKYVTSFEGAKKYVEITGDIPARYSVAKEFSELSEYPKNIFVHQAQNNSKNRPVTSAYPVVSDAVRALFEDIGIAGRDVNEAADAAVEKIDASLRGIQRR